MTQLFRFDQVPHRPLRQVLVSYDELAWRHPDDYLVHVSDTEQLRSWLSVWTNEDFASIDLPAVWWLDDDFFWTYGCEQVLYDGLDALGERLAMVSTVIVAQPEFQSLALDVNRLNQFFPGSVVMVNALDVLKIPTKSHSGSYDYDGPGGYL